MRVIDEEATDTRHKALRFQGKTGRQKNQSTPNNL
jgi:hypothetical protein